MRSTFRSRCCARIGAAIWVGAASDRLAARRIPVLAAALGTGSVLALVLGLTLGSDRGWDRQRDADLPGLCLVLLVGFVRNENRLGQRPDRSGRCGARPRCGSGAGATALYMASVGSEFFLLTLLLQSVKGYSPLKAGLAFLPLALMVTAGSTTAGRAVRRFSASTVLTAGFTIATVGLLWLVADPARGLLPHRPAARAAAQRIRARHYLHVDVHRRHP